MKKQIAKLLSDNHVQDAQKKNHKNRWNVIANIIFLFFVIISVSYIEWKLHPTKRSIENHSTVYAIFRGKGSFSISHFRFFLFHRIGAINLRYIFEISIFVQKKNCINIYMYTGCIYTHIHNCFRQQLRYYCCQKKNIKKKKNE